MTTSFGGPSLGIPGVYLLDEEAAVRDSLTRLLRSRRLRSRRLRSRRLRSRRLRSQGFANAEVFAAFVASRDLCGGWPDAPSCLLLEVRMPGASGLVLFDRLVEQGLIAALPVIFLTGHGDVPTAVAAVKRGASDFAEKPFSDNAQVDGVEQALVVSGQAIVLRRRQAALARSLVDLTEREREVASRVVAGLDNQLIADELDISVRTVEVHRARMFEKMNVRSAVELANLLRERQP